MNTLLGHKLIKVRHSKLKMELGDRDKTSMKEAKESIQQIAEQNKLLSSATVSKEEKAFNATAFYVFDEDFNFYILTEPELITAKI